MLPSCWGLAQGRRDGWLRGWPLDDDDDRIIEERTEQVYGWHLLWAFMCGCVCTQIQRVRVLCRYLVFSDSFVPAKMLGLLLLRQLLKYHYIILLVYGL